MTTYPLKHNYTFLWTISNIVITKESRSRSVRNNVLIVLKFFCQKRFAHFKDKKNERNVCVFRKNNRLFVFRR